MSGINPEILGLVVEVLRAKLDLQASPKHTPPIIFQYTTSSDLKHAREIIIHETLVERDPNKVAIGSNRIYPTSEDVAQFEWSTRMPDHQIYYLNGAPVEETLAFLAYDGIDPKYKERIAKKVIQEAAKSYQRLQEYNVSQATGNIIRRMYRRLLSDSDS